MEMLVRRGFLWQSFEIYGGIAGFIDFAPLGNGLRRNIESIWRNYFIINERAVEIDSPTIGIEDVFIASGHVGSFTDVAIECRECKRVFRADHYIKEKLGIESDESIDSVSEILDMYELKCECGGKFNSPEYFNLMFSTAIGPGKGKKSYLRPETAQGIFIDFKRLLDYFRGRLPFGTAQIGRVYRNEISPRQGVIRLREFNQAEIEYFVDPRAKSHDGFDKYKELQLKLVDRTGSEYNITLGEAVSEGIIAHELIAYFMGKTYLFLLEIGLDEKRIRFRQHKDDEKAHYALDCWDAESFTDYGWIEVVGIADRGSYDLTQHSTHSKEDMSVFVQFKKPKKVRVKRFKPLMSKLGPEFRQNAKKVAEQIEKYDGEISDTIHIQVDGEDISIGSELFEVEDIEQDIYGEKITPHVIEPSFGLDRITYSVLNHSFERDIVDGEERKVLLLKRWMAPVKIAVLPLMPKKGFVEKASEITKMLKRAGIFTEYDDSGSIGRRYRRYDEIGTPFCITIDHQTLEDETVTIRDRDSTKQVRVGESSLVETITGLLNSEKEVIDVGVEFKS